MKAEEALLSMRGVIEGYGDEKVKHSFYLEFNRRLLVLHLIEECCQKGSVVIDLGAQPFIVSCALKLMGYEVIAYDYDPEPYSSFKEVFGVKARKCDLERDNIDVGDESVDCAVFTEVLEHLNPYYVSHTMSEINRVLKPRGRLILTTPNIASLFRRLRLLLGIQPQYAIHVHEYTKKEVEELLKKHGFRVIRSLYSEVNDLTFVDAEPRNYLSFESYQDLLKLTIRRPTKLNVLRALAYPLVKIVPSLRMLIVVIAEKTSYVEFRRITRW